MHSLPCEMGRVNTACGVRCLSQALPNASGFSETDTDSDKGDCTRRWGWPICGQACGFHRGMSQSFQGRPTLVDHVLVIREEIKLLETSVEAREKVLRAIEATDLSQAQTIEQAISLIIKTYSTDPRQ